MRTTRRMRPSRTLRRFIPSLLVVIAVFACAAPAFGRGSIDRQVLQAACAKGAHRAAQGSCLRSAGSLPVHVIVFGRPPASMLDGDVVDGTRLRLIGARSAVVAARDLKQLAAAHGVRRIALDAPVKFADTGGTTT